MKFLWIHRWWIFADSAGVKKGKKGAKLKIIPKTGRLGWLDDCSCDELSLGVEIRRFRHFASIQCHWFFALGIGLIWALFTFGVSGEDYDWGDEEAEVRFVERELMLLEAGRDGGFFLEWWTEQGDREKTLKQLEVILADHEESERVAELRSYFADSDASREVFSDEEQSSQLQRSLVVGLPWMLALGGGIWALLVVRKDWRKGGRIWRVAGAFSPWTVLTTFFVAELAVDYFINGSFGGFFYLFFGDDWGLLFENLIWRGAPGLLAAFAIIGSWRGIGRVYGLGESVRWRAVLGSFCVVALLETLLQWLGAESEVIDTSDFLGLADPGWWDLFFDVMDGVVFAPVFEELMFRGVLFLGIVRRLGPLPAAIISSLLFAVVHTQYDAWEIVSVGIFGMACCWLTWRTGSIKSSIVLHMIYNGLVTAWVYVLYQMPL